MRKVFLFMMTTLDGYFEGPNHDISWHNVDAEFNVFADKQLDETDTLIFGHRTYDLMASFWPSKEGLESAPNTAMRMNSLKKIVVSHQSFTPTWEPTRVFNDTKMLNEVKTQPGKSIAVLGSSNLSVSLLNEGLIDEIRIMVNPVVIGKGTPLLDGISLPNKFTFIDSRNFTNGNVLLRYKTEA